MDAVKKRSVNRRMIGNAAEDEAARFLERHHYKILTRNYRSHFGEIDIIAKDRTHTVFVEVKSRGTSLFGSPQDSVVSRKRRRITLTAIDYIQRNRLEGRPVRFDVIAINPDSSVELIKNAFDAEYR